MDSAVGRRLVFVLTLSLVGFVGLGFRLYQLMMHPEKQYCKSHSRMYQGHIYLPAQRGHILDRNSNPLATEKTAWDLYVTGRPENPKEFARIVGSTLNQDPETLIKRLPEKDGQDKLVSRDIPGEIYDQLAAALEKYSETTEKEERAKWSLRPRFLRFYPEGDLASNVIGYVGADQVGLGGIEYTFQNRLEGAPERVIVPVDSLRNILAENDYIKQANVRGADVILTIDAWIQHTVEQEIRNLMDRSQATQAMAVVIEPKTGEILAMAAVPSFDPNDYQRYGEFRRKCRPVTDMFEPGSVIKPFIVAGALEAGAVTPDRVFDCERGNYAVRGANGRVLKVIHDDIHRFDRLSVRDIVVRSSNIGICKIAAQLGAAGVSDILRRFGFGLLSGVELPGETPGILRSPDSRGWSALSMYAMPYGQEMAMNCLVITAAYSILANRGLRVQPHIVRGYCNPADGRISLRESQPPERIIATEIAEQVVEMLIGVTEDPEGTGYRYCRIPGFRVAGKTGTAQKAGPTGTYEKGKRIASWAGFFPAYDPKAVIFLMVDEPTIGKYGGELAGSSFARIAEKLIRYWGLLPDQIEPWIRATSQKTESWVDQEVDDATQTIPSKSAPEPVRRGVMPDLTGLSAKEAYLKLVEAGFRATFEGTGRVLHQEISAGEIPSTFHAGQVVLGSDPYKIRPAEVLASIPDVGKPHADTGK